jgi:hypothetical protein
MGSSVVSHRADRRTVPLLGLRRRPGRLALTVFRLPLGLYQRGWGWLMGDTPDQRFLSEDESLAVVTGR